MDEVGDPSGETEFYDEYVEGLDYPPHARRLNHVRHRWRIVAISTPKVWTTTVFEGVQHSISFHSISLGCCLLRFTSIFNTTLPVQGPVLVST